MGIRNPHSDSRNGRSRGCFSGAYWEIEAKGLLFGSLDLLTGPDNWVGTSDPAWVHGPPTSYIQTALNQYDALCQFLNPPAVAATVS